MEGDLSEQEARAVEEAVAGADEDTLADIAWLRKFRTATEAVLIESPPQEVRDALIEVFEANVRDRRRPGFVERVLAGLTSDSNLQPAAGLRAVGAQQSRRQLIYHAGMFDLAVNLLARVADNDLDIDGLVLPREDVDPEIISVQLLRDGDEHALAAVDEFGTFTILRVPPGRYELILSADRVEVSVWPLDVGL
jgi:hypothetical protein